MSSIMPLRIGTSLTICFAVLIGSGLGLNKGMVLCIDGDGHLALESAHVEHARCHAEDADHLPHEFPVDGEHAELHAALETCFDAAVGSVHLRSANPPSVRPCDFPAPPYVIRPNPRLQLSLFGSSSKADSASGAIPRLEMTCLSSIILLV